ncbi:MAG: dephospho-CoA kinase [Elusimicrobiota bacterium]
MPRRKNKNWRVVIGLTGGIGSGKSTVLKMFNKKKVFTSDSDVIVSGLLEDTHVLKKIRNKFGSDVFLNGKLNKSVMAKKVFSSLKMKKTLEKILHPLVKKELFSQLHSHRGDIAILDIPLLYESKWDRYLDKVIVVDSPMVVRIKRLQKRGMAMADIKSRMKAQWPLAQKVKKADFVIRNGGSVRETQNQVSKIWNIIAQHP